MSHDVTDDDLIPSTDPTPADLQSEPGDTNPKIVPEAMQDAGHGINEPRDDSPASSTDDEHLEEGESLIEPLAEDNAAPFSPPTDPIADPTADIDVRTQSGQLDPTHQATDNATDIDSQQLYDEGLSGAAEASEPNAGNTVVDYSPDKDERIDSSS